MKKPTLKSCGRCRQPKPLLDFHALGETGRAHPFCLACLNDLSLEKEKARQASTHVRLRTCAQCEQAFPVECFHWIKATRVRHSYCRACHAAYMALRYLRKKAGRQKVKSAGGWTGT